jgi:hypothetical protein
MFCVGVNKIGMKAVFYIISSMINSECKIKGN